MKKLDNLSQIYNQYDAFIIDLWGVVHNGISLNSGASNVIEKLSSNGKKVIFLSNAPRPSASVIKFLEKINMKKKFLNNVMTSGEAAKISLKKMYYGKKFYHLGPERDNILYKGLDLKKTIIEECEFILCTGLFDDQMENLDYYNSLLNEHTKKKLICTNPDLIVHRGSKSEYCAGKIAEIFEKMGGEVIYFGKPYKEIYNICINLKQKNLIIGDNLKTDIKGANNMGIDSLFITSGVHRSEFKNTSDLEILLKNYKVKTNYFQNLLTW